MDLFRTAYALVRSYRKERPYPVEGERKALPYEVDVDNPLYRHAIVYETSAQLVVRFMKVRTKMNNGLKDRIARAMKERLPSNSTTSKQGKS